jgi:hypothetical protein
MYIRTLIDTMRFEAVITINFFFFFFFFLISNSNLFRKSAEERNPYTREVYKRALKGTNRK